MRHSGRTISGLAIFSQRKTSFEVPLPVAQNFVLVLVLVLDLAGEVASI
jgi:hypothetical protein